MRPGPVEPPSAVDLLKRTPLDQLEEKVGEFKLLYSAEQLRTALIERIAHAPLRDFEKLKGIYLKYCADAPR